MNKRNKRLLGPLEQVLVIGAYVYDLGSDKCERKRRRLVVQGLPGCQSRARSKQMKQMTHGDGTSSAALLTAVKRTS